MNNSNWLQEIHTKSGPEILFTALSQVFKTLFSKQLKRSDRQSSKPKFERCTCPNDLKMMAGGFNARIGSTKSNIK